MRRRSAPKSRAAAPHGDHRPVRPKRRRKTESPQPHPFAVERIRVVSASGVVREINPRSWAEYGLKGI